MFFQFLKQEYSEENLLFINDVKEYKSLLTKEERKLKAEEMCMKYIKQDASLEVYFF